MVKLRLAPMLRKRKMTAYRLSKLTGLSLPTVYRLAKAEAVTRLEMETLDKLCSALECEVSDLLVRTK